MATSSIVYQQVRTSENNPLPSPPCVKWNGKTIALLSVGVVALVASVALGVFLSPIGFFGLIGAALLIGSAFYLSYKEAQATTDTSTRLYDFDPAHKLEPKSLENEKRSTHSDITRATYILDGKRTPEIPADILKTPAEIDFKDSLVEQVDTHLGSLSDDEKAKVFAGLHQGLLSTFTLRHLEKQSDPIQYNIEVGILATDKKGEHFTPHHRTLYRLDTEEKKIYAEHLIDRRTGVGGVAIDFTPSATQKTYTLQQFTYCYENGTYAIDVRHFNDPSELTETPFLYRDLSSLPVLGA